MDIKLEDFDRYRDKLLNYSKALTRTYSTYTYDYEDIVQNAYLQYHSFCYLNNFKLKEHQNLEKLLINMLYFSYKRSISEKYNKQIRHKYKEQKFAEFPLELHPIEELSLDLRMDVGVLNRVFTERQLNIFNMAISGYSFSEIARDNNVSRQAIDHNLKYIKKKILKWLE